MLRFRDALNNDNPVSDDLNLHELNTWYYALILIGSNLFGGPLIIYCHRHAFFLLAAATFFAVVVSLLYHTCQTTGVCFGFSLSVLTLADHITAPSFMMMLILFIINTKSSKQIRRETKRLYVQELERPVIVDLQPQQYKAPPLPNLHFIDTVALDSKYDSATFLSDDDIDEAESQKTYHHVGYSHITSNDENNAWGVYIMYSSIFVVILAALAHNFSLQAFIIAFVYGLAAIFFKHIIIDEGTSIGMYERVSLPDLIAGVVCLALSLVFYMLDIYVAYAITHSLWHVLSFTGSYLMVVGLSKHCDYWYSPIDYCYRRILKCCINREIEEEPLIIN